MRSLGDFRSLRIAAVSVQIPIDMAAEWIVAIETTIIDPSDPVADEWLRIATALERDPEAVHVSAATSAETRIGEVVLDLVGTMFENLVAVRTEDFVVPIRLR